MSRLFRLAFIKEREDQLLGNVNAFYHQIYLPTHIRSKLFLYRTPLAGYLTENIYLGTFFAPFKPISTHSVTASSTTRRGKLSSTDK